MRPVRPVLRGLVTTALLASTAGRPCAGCRGPSAAAGGLCPACGELLLGPAYAAQLAPRPRGLPPVFAVAPYAGPVREAVVAFKDHGRWPLRTPLAHALAVAVAGAMGELDLHTAVLVTVPGSPGSARARDADHVRELAARAARELGAQGAGMEVADALTSVRRRRDQVGLGRLARAQNLDHAMAPTTRALALRALTGSAPVVLVDDVVTTGATLAEAARALRSVGVEPVAAAVVAATGRPSPAGR